MTTPVSRTGRHPASLTQELELNKIELEAQNAALSASNEALRQTNADLVVARDHFQSLYDLAPTAYVTVDADRVILDVNRAAEALLATPQLRLVSGRLELFIADSDRVRFNAFIEEVFLAGSPRCGDVSMIRSDGVEIDVQIDAVVLRAESVGVPRCVLAIVDVTARHQAELTRRRTQDETLAMVSHDLRGPLSTIGLACDALGDLSDDGQQARYVAAIRRAAQRCERMIRDLLGAAQLDSGGFALELSGFDAHELVREVCRDHAGQAAASGATLIARVGDHPERLVADRDRLYQALANLIRNALIHAPRASIEVEVVSRGDELRFAVTDDGPGLAPDELPHIFERYHRGVRKGEGVGLGLAIVKALVEAHHGSATVTSQPGQGARFQIAVPRNQIAAGSADRGHRARENW